MTLDIYGRRHGGDMTREGLYMNGQGCAPASHSLGTYPQIVDPFEKGFFHIRIKWIRIMGT